MIRTVIVKVVLDCSHIVSIQAPSPEPGSLQFCQACDDYQIVSETPRPFMVRCMSRRGCYDGACQSYEAAKKKLDKHTRDMPHHRVRILLQYRVVGQYAGQADGYTIVKSELIAEGNELAHRNSVASSSGAHTPSF